MNFILSDKIVGGNRPCFIIAEISANHNQDFNLTAETIDAAIEAGADAVKFQTYTADTITIDSDKDYFKINHGTIWDGCTLYELYKKGSMPWEWLPRLKKICDDKGIVCFSSPFDKSAIDFLEGMNVPAFKIASPEITDIPLIDYAASKGKPVILSTGIATYDDIKNAVNACRLKNNHKIAILKCTSAYPASPKDANLRTILDMEKRFDTVVGISDHTLGIAVPVTAVSQGAKILEKHFVLNKSVESLDSKFSLDSIQFKNMVKSIRIAEDAIGTINYELSDESKRARQNCRSLFVVRDVCAGDKFNEKNIKSIRPGQGLAPKYLNKILGKIAKKDYSKGTPVTYEMANIC